MSQDYGGGNNESQSDKIDVVLYLSVFSKKDWPIFGILMIYVAARIICLMAITKRVPII